jgi:hypothetical protein
MMGFRFDQPYGPGTKRCFSFDFDEFLMGVFYSAVLVFLFVASWKLVK